MSGISADPDTAVKSHALCEEIVHFLSEHDGAMDTVQGVAAFWVDSEEVAVKSALDCLSSAGVVVARTLSSGTYYSLTTDPKVRNWLRTRQWSLPVRRQASRRGADGAGILASESV